LQRVEKDPEGAKDLHASQHKLAFQWFHVTLNQTRAHYPNRKYDEEDSPGKPHGFGFPSRRFSDRRENSWFANLGRIDRVLAGDADAARGRQQLPTGRAGERFSGELFVRGTILGCLALQFVRLVLLSHSGSQQAKCSRLFIPTFMLLPIQDLPVDFHTR
jgi:hypothetical protein